MNLKPSEYVDYAPSVVGEQVHINHEGCTAGVDRKKRLYIKRESSCLIAFCHHCGYKGIYRLSGSQPRPLSVLRNKGVAMKKVKDVYFPSDCTFLPHEFSLDAKVWLYKYRLTDAQIISYHIGYSKHLDRAILPVMGSKGELVFWQARALHGEEPKYYSEASVDKPYFIVPNNPDKQIVLVEDMLSAIRVGEQENALALLGTTLSDNVISAILKGKYESIVVWLDSDVAGERAGLKMRNKLNLLFDKVRFIHHKQPKELSNLSISIQLKGI